MGELTIYQKHPEADAYRVGGSYAPYAIVAHANRFTGPELAAEYWHATSNYHAAVFRRFAEAEHFDGAS